MSQKLSVLEKLQLQNGLNALSRQRLALVVGAPLYAFKYAAIAAKRTTIWGRLGIDMAGPARVNGAFRPETPPELPAVPREDSGQFYDYDDDRTKGQRKKFNVAAISLLADIEAGRVDGTALTVEQKATLAKYSGTGGNLTGADGKEGSDYEYYTPKPIADGMWSLLAELGFKGGKVLDPCAGTGIFGSSAPANAAIESIELNETSGRINQLVNGGPAYNAIVSPFEAVASRTEDELYDAVITNVPFGGKDSRGSNRRLDDKYQDDTLETYFIMRSLEKLRPGGLAAFVVPPRVVSGKGAAEEKLRTRCSYIAEFMGAYRMPNTVFGSAAADTITDVIVFRKFGRDALTKIAELKAQDTKTLIAANVLWTEFLSGLYFMGEGKRNVLGEFVAKDSTKYRDVDRVISDQTIPNIGKLLRKFPGSRIDWKLIEATETDPIEYRDGDTMTMAGLTLELREGKWVSIGAATSNDLYDGLAQSLTNPIAAVNAKVTWEQASGYVAYLIARSKEMDLMPWLRDAWRDVNGNDEADRAAAWLALSAGLAAVYATQDHGSTPQFDYTEAYPVVTEALQASAAYARRSAPRYSAGSKAALAKHRLTYDRKSGFSNQWKGDGQADVTIGTIGEQEQVAALKYTGQTVDIETGKLREIFGQDFDPLTDDEWCVNAAGTHATKADDYYIGNLGEFLARLDAEIKAADGDLKNKLLRQREIAMARVDTVDPSNLKFNLFSPFVDIEEKAEFLRRFVHPAFVVTFDDEGKKKLFCDVRNSTGDTLAEAEKKRQLRRFSIYLGAGNMSTGTTEAEIKSNSTLDTMRRKMLRDMAVQANAQFDTWTKANPSIMERMRVKANDPARLYFTEIDDNSPLDVPGMSKALNPKTGKPFELHGFQRAFVRKQGRAFGGINGFDVGLGKTFTALACAQYVHSIGVKKKTVFVVPNSVLSNWRKEAGIAYESTEDCLFIGLDFAKDGTASVDPANYARDFTRVLENRHRKIFCTVQAFKSIPLRDETIADYGSYLMEIDPSYEDSTKKGDSERAASKRSDVLENTGAKSSAIPYFEDMGVDSLVIDEAHQYKNSKNTVDFSGAKFLSVAKSSDQGADMQIKAWFIRGLTSAGDGVLPLTATPITNSPLEIYSMLTLAVGEKKVHDLTMGAAGADAFMNAMCQIEDDEELSIDGKVKPYRVFRGLMNVDMLRSAINSIATIKTGADVKLAGDDLKLPDAPETKTAVRLPAETLELLNQYKMAYRAAKEITGTAAKDAQPCTPEEIAAFDRVQARFGERPELIAHPFNLITKMTDLIADPELDQRASFYVFEPGQAVQAAAAVAAFNKVGKIEARDSAGTYTEAVDIVGETIKKRGDNETRLLKIKVQAYIKGDRIAIDTLDSGIQAEFEKQAAKVKLSLDVTVPPKLAALLENVLKEEAHPRSASRRVKQIVFCDLLPMHNKIKLILSKRAGIPAAAIVIVTGKSIKDAEQMQDIQDGFNAEGADNKYRCILANKKAEVGVNLQKGTQAIHHLTIGWTPDSQHQRNGRGVRQGNDIDYVNLYHYDADGTFDEYKRTLTTKKADWIGAVMDKQGGNEVSVSGRLSTQQYEEMIESMGDPAAMAAIQERAATRERLARADTAKKKQLINLQTAVSEAAFQATYAKVETWIVERVMAAYDMKVSIAALRTRSNMKMSAGAQIKIENRIAETEATLAGMIRTIEESATFNSGSSTMDVAAYFRRADGKSGANARNAVEKSMVWWVKPIAGGVLGVEWESNMESSRAMTAEALKEVERIGNGSEGGLPARIGQSFRDGHGAMIDGVPFARGMFLRNPTGDLYVLSTGDMAVRFPRAEQKVADAISRKWEVIGFDSPGYAGAVAEAAAFDDEAKDVSIETKARLFSAIVPEVAQQMKTAIYVSYAADNITLPAPGFPYPVNGKFDLSPLVRNIATAQSKIVKEWGSYRTVLIDATADVTVHGYNKAPTAGAKLSALIAYAKGHSTPLTMTDYAVVAYGEPASRSTMAYEFVERGTWPEIGAVDALLAKAADLVGVEGAKAALLQAALGDFLVIDSTVSFDMAAPYMVKQRVNFRRGEILRAEQAIEAARVAALQPVPVVAPIAEPVVPVEPAADAPAAVPASDVMPNDKGMIGITGETLKKFNFDGAFEPAFKAVKKAAIASGGRAVWNREAQRWDVTAATWPYLCATYPEVAKVLYPVPA